MEINYFEYICVMGPWLLDSPSSVNGMQMRWRRIARTEGDSEAIFQRTINDSSARAETEVGTESHGPLTTDKQRTLPRLDIRTVTDPNSRLRLPTTLLKPTEVVVQEQQHRQRLFLGDFRISLSPSNKTVKPWIQLNLYQVHTGQLPINKHEEHL